MLLFLYVNGGLVTWEHECHWVLHAAHIHHFGYIGAGDLDSAAWLCAVVPQRVAFAGSERPLFKKGGHRPQ